MLLVDADTSTLYKLPTPVSGSELVALIVNGDALRDFHLEGFATSPKRHPGC